MTTDCELLRHYAEQGDESAFTEIARRNVDLVYSAALRQTGGNAHLAQDVTQTVFTSLARQARGLSRRASITGWLYTTTKFTACKLMRGERRRFAREQEAFTMQDTTHTPEPDWDLLRPALDEAVCQLNATDREAVLLRFFQNKSHREVGDVLGLNEDTARKRIERALEKLRTYFVHRGVTVSTTLLATAISANSVQAAPAGLAASIAGTSLAGAASGALSGSLIKTFLMTTKTKIALAAAFIVVATVSTISQQRQIARLNAELASERKNISALSSKIASANPFASASLADRVAAISKFLRKQNGMSPAELMRGLLDAVNGLKPDEFRGILDAVKKMPKGDGGKVVIGTLLSRWAENDPTAALAWAKQQTSDSDHGDYILAAFVGWAAKDMTAALAAVNQVNDVSVRNKIEANLLARLTNGDPQAAAAAAAGLPIGQERNMAISAVASTWAATDPTAAFAWAKNVATGQIQDKAIEDILAQMSQVDPTSAVALLSQISKPSVRNTAITQLATAWAQQDVQSALAWAQSLPPSDFGNAMDGVVTTWAQTEPASAAAYVQTITSYDNFNGLADQVAKNWITVDPQATLAWVQGLPAGNGQDIALRDAVTIYANFAPQEALAYASAIPDNDSDARSKTLGFVIQTWSAENPATAATHLSDLASETATDQSVIATATSVVAKNWAMQDPTAASQWIDTLPAGDPRDGAILQFIKINAENDPAKAYTWASSLSMMGGPKNSTINAVVQHWAQTDPSAATAAIETDYAGNDQRRSALLDIINNANTPGRVGLGFPTMRFGANLIAPPITNSPSP